MSKYLFVRQKVSDVDQWLRVFNSHAEFHKEAGLVDCRLLRDVDDPYTVTCMFRVEDVDKALAFIRTPEAEQGKTDSGVIGEPEAIWLEDL